MLRAPHPVASKPPFPVTGSRSSHLCPPLPSADASSQQQHCGTLAPVSFPPPHPTPFLPLCPPAPWLRRYASAPFIASPHINASGSFERGMSHCYSPIRFMHARPSLKADQNATRLQNDSVRRQRCSSGNRRLRHGRAAASKLLRRVGLAEVGFTWVRRAWS